MSSQAPTTTNVIAVLVATIAALFSRSWLQLELIRRGYQYQYAADLAWLVVPPLLLLLLLPVLRQDWPFLKRRFRRTDLDWRLFMLALATGVLLRLAWWSQLIAGVAFGIYRNDDPFAVTGPAFAFACPAPQVLILGFVVMALLVPLIEELTHRAYVQTALVRFGPVVAIAGSATVFTLLHKPGSWEFVFLAGVVLGVQYHLTGSIWLSLITHATVNGLIQVDWRCVNGQWNPHVSELPLSGIGSVASLIFLSSMAGIVCLLYARKYRGG